MGMFQLHELALFTKSFYAQQNEVNLNLLFHKGDWMTERQGELLEEVR